MAAVRRKASERGEDLPAVPRDAITVAMKRGRKLREVRPFVWEWVERWGKRHGVWRPMVMFGVALRLMLRPGEVGKIRVEHVRRGREGVLVRLVGRKSDKVLRKDPWHMVECGGEFCVACGLWALREEARERGHEFVFIGRNGGISVAEFTEGMNRIAWELGMEERGKRFFTGKSCRVGGAMAAALGGVSEMEIRLTGSWKSDALFRYIGGIMGAKSGLMEVVKRADGASVWLGGWECREEGCRGPWEGRGSSSSSF